MVWSLRLRVSHGGIAVQLKHERFFTLAQGQEAIITNPESIARALKGETGTRIVP